MASQLQDALAFSASGLPQSLAEEGNAGIPLLQALNSLLSGGFCIAASVLLLDENAGRASLALAPSERRLEARRLSLPLPKFLLSSLEEGRVIAVSSADEDAATFIKALFPNAPCGNGSLVASPMRISGGRAAFLAGLIPADAETLSEEGGSGFSEIIAKVAALAESASKDYLRAADLQSLPFEKGGDSIAVTVSQIMKEKLAVVKAVADSPSPMLFVGEDGAGKEFYARKLHSLSRRANEPFVRVNCPAFSDKCLDSLLFGAGGDDDGEGCHCGLLEKAKGGTVLLRGIESLSLSLQERLMTVIQSGQIEKEGGAASFRARVTAATSCDLEKLVAARKFRADLYYALSVIPLYLPPLAARREDIIPLSYLFLKEAATETAKPFLFFSAGAEAALLTHSWRGNARELKAAIACACVFGSPPCVTEENLLLNNHPIPEYNASDDKTLKSVMTVLKRHHVLRILAENGWNQTAAAKVLGIQRTYLSRLIKELKIREQ